MNNYSPIKKLLSRLKDLININELTFDITISVAAILVYRLIVPMAGFLLLNMSFPVTLVILFCMKFFIALYFADLIRRYSEVKK